MHKKLITALTLSAMALPLATTSTVLAAAPGSGMNSNATLKVTKDDKDTSLILVTVPSFAYGDVVASKIINGENITIAGSPNLQINDQRATQASWTLSVNGTVLTGNGKTLPNTSLSTNGENISDISIILGGSDGSGTGSGSITSTLTGTLKFESNPSLVLETNDQFTSKLTWTLNAGTPPASGL